MRDRNLADRFGPPIQPRNAVVLVVVVEVVEVGETVLSATGQFSVTMAKQVDDDTGMIAPVGPVAVMLPVLQSL
jgi:hypothetical protein